MKKIKISLIPLVLIVIAFFATNCSQDPNEQINEKLIGTWQICKADSTLDLNVENYTDLSRYKVVTKESFVVMHFGNNSKKVAGTFWGTYDINDGIYTEYVQYSNYTSVLGAKNSFNLKFEDDYMFVKGVNNDYEEIWKKVKD